MLFADTHPDIFAALPMDGRIALAAADFLGSRYSRDNHFPAQRPGFPPSLLRQGETQLGIDCSSLGAYVLVTATPGGLWTEELYAMLQIFDPADPWSPITATERAGVGSRVDAPVAGLWHVTQRWEDPHPATVDGDGLAGGHFRICRAHKQEPDRLLVLESTTRDNKIGPRWTYTRWSSLLNSAREKGGDCRCAALGAGISR